MFEAVVALASTAAGAIAAVSGFGIGSILTPLFAIQIGTKLAVAAVSVPHLFATTLRFWLLRRQVDRQVLLTFGIVSAAGGLAGAILHSQFSSPILTSVFAFLLLLAGATEVLGGSQRLRLGRGTALFGGAISGLLGGMVGNQGGIRSAALLAFNLEPRVFVATATCIALLVDFVRMPVYLMNHRVDLEGILPWIALASGGALVGTLLGERFLQRIPEMMFRRLVGWLIVALGVAMLFQATAN